MRDVLRSSCGGNKDQSAESGALSGNFAPL